ncbi:MAG: type II toxin-antitoxin system RelE/ParE family toxin [bacterium]
MKRYRVEFTPSARREFLKLSDAVVVRLAPRILALGKNPRPAGSKKLSVQEDIYRIRIGDYRVLYEIQDKVLVVLVVKVGHRREIYR